MTRQLLPIEGWKCREDDPWDVFIVDDDEYDPDPEPGDFWPDDDLPFTDEGRVDNLFCSHRREVLPCSH